MFSKLETPDARQFLCTATGGSNSPGRVHRKYANHCCENQENSSWVPEFYFLTSTIVVFRMYSSWYLWYIQPVEISSISYFLIWNVFLCLTKITKVLNNSFLIHIISKHILRHPVFPHLWVSYQTPACLTGQAWPSNQSYYWWSELD